MKHGYSKVAISYRLSSFNKLSFFEVYDHVQINYLRNDDQYIIQALGGDTIFHDNIENVWKNVWISTQSKESTTFWVTSAAVFVSG